MKKLSIIVVRVKYIKTQIYYSERFNFLTENLTYPIYLIDKLILSNYDKNNTSNNKIFNTTVEEIFVLRVP